MTLSINSARSSAPVIDPNGYHIQISPTEKKVIKAAAWSIGGLFAGGLAAASGYGMYVGLALMASLPFGPLGVAITVAALVTAIFAVGIYLKLTKNKNVIAASQAQIANQTPQVNARSRSAAARVQQPGFFTRFNPFG